MFDNKKLWESVLTEIELQLSKANFITWFKDTSISRQEDGVVFLAVPNAFAKDWLARKYHKMILKSLRNIAGYVRGIEYVISKLETKDKESVQRTAAPNVTPQLPLADYYINKDDNLNPRYNFESFVVGPFNELAYAASQAVIKKPGIAYNPLFVYGNTGHGKTHLIQAIGNHIKSSYAGKKVYYITFERFNLDFVNSVLANKIGQFKEKYRKYDVFIMDDVQFLSSKEKTQEELFHLFNTLYDNNKQIVFSSDKHPNFIPNLEDRLKSRFAAGMIVDIPPPDHESRVAIIKTKLSAQGFSLMPGIIEFVAESIQGNIRELEGVVNSIICQSQIKKRELELEEVKEIIKNSVKPKKSVVVKNLVKAVANFYNLEEETIYQKTRKKEVVKPRQLIMYILREDYNISYPSIGQRLGGRDHTTVIHSCEKIKEELKTDSNLIQELNQIRAVI